MDTAPIIENDIQYSGRGRPRPTETILRDRMVYGLLCDRDMTNKEISEHLGESMSKVWGSLNRLRNAGKIRICLDRNNYRVWTAKADAPCP